MGSPNVAPSTRYEAAFPPAFLLQLITVTRVAVVHLVPVVISTESIDVCQTVKRRCDRSVVLRHYRFIATNVHIVLPICLNLVIFS